MISGKYTTVDNINIHYLMEGEGEAVLLIHGWPTSSYLWRNIVTALSKNYKVIAIDLPGYGKSSKRLEDSYSFRYYSRILSGFLEKLKLDKVTLGVHDVGGPIGLYWAVNHMEKIDRLILFNTLVYPKFSMAVKLFGLATIMPVLKHQLTTPSGIKRALYFGVNQKFKLKDTTIRHYQTDVADRNSRKIILKAVQNLSNKGFQEIEEKLPLFKCPVLIIYGTYDKILPKVSNTMKKVKEDLPQAEIVSLTKCGHFLQEEEPEQIAEIMSEFMSN